MSTVASRFQGEAFAAIRDGSVRLAVGAKGESVRSLQETLRDMGFACPGGADGSFGKQTETAVKNFQRHVATREPSFAVHGEVDATTLQRLESLAPPVGVSGQTANIPSPVYDGRKVRLVVAKHEHRTFLYDPSGALTHIFPNAVGAQASTTDTGLKKIATKLGQRDADSLGQTKWGHAGVFGARVLDLRWADGKHSGEELHGTSAPQDLGKDVSHGCVRHHNEDIVVIYDAVSVGDLVAIVERADDPYLAGGK